MTAYLRHHLLIFAILLPVLLLLAILQLPPDEFILALVLLFSGVAIAGFAIARKQRNAYLRGQITKSACLRNILLDANYVLLVMVLAGLLGRNIAALATRQVQDDVLKYAAGILIALPVGTIIGIFVRRLWMRIQFIDLKN